MAHDKLNPSHYQGFSNGAIPWDIAERLNYNRGTALVYIARAGRKEGESALDDLQKAQRYLEREIERIVSDGKETPLKPIADAARDAAQAVAALNTSAATSEKGGAPQ